jgi:solute carrier family 10 (sodium/bile acid cotransporter), member 7
VQPRRLPFCSGHVTGKRAMIRIDGFLASLIAVVLLSALMPQLGATGGLLHLEWIARFGIAAVFFLYGLTLAPEKLRAGALHWRLHVTVQGICFIGFPLVMLIAGTLVKDRLDPNLWIGFLYLAALPGTISSAVAMTSLARGNVPAAVFNATISGIIAVVATPTLMALLADISGVKLPLGEIIGKVLLLILLPMAIGQLARLRLAAWTSRNMRWIKPLDRLVILAIVANAFSDSMLQGLWQSMPPLLIGEMTLACLALFAFMHAVAMTLSSALGFGREDRIATLLSATQKSLATGVPLAPVIFGATPALGLIITPIMIYHLLQLVIVGVLASRWSEAKSAPA